MIKICKWNCAPVQTEDGERYSLRLNFLREDLGWCWIKSTIEGITLNRVKIELGRLKNDGYELFKD